MSGPTSHMNEGGGSLGNRRHLDSNTVDHHDDIMRTTVTLDQDVEQLLRKAMHRSRTGFKETLNDAIRAGLAPKLKSAAKRPFVVQARPLGLRAGLDPTGFNKLADELEMEAVLGKIRREGIQ